MNSKPGLTKRQWAFIAIVALAPVLSIGRLAYRYSLTMDLQEAIAWRDNVQVKSLLARGADVFARTPSNHTAMGLAAGTLRWDTDRIGEDAPRNLLCNMLLDEVAKRGYPTDTDDAVLEMSIYTCRRDVASHYAFTSRWNELHTVEDALMSRPSSLMFWLELRPDYVNFTYPSGHGTLLRTAASLTSRGKSYAELLRYLLDHGADANARDSDGTTALMFAWTSEAVQMLLNHGALIDDRDSEGRTALMWSAWNGHEDSVRALVERGADPRVVSRSGETAQSLAQQLHRKSIAALLQQLPVHGSAVGARSRSARGRTPGGGRSGRRSWSRSAGR